MHVIALVESPQHVCCRFRLAAFRPHLERAGHHLELRPLPRHWWSQLRVASGLRGADVVVLQRRLLGRLPLHFLRSAVPWLVFDFDDAVFLRDSYSRRGLTSGSRLRRFAAAVRAADAVVAGNDFLRQAAAHWTSARRVHVIPTCVNPSRYPPALHTRKGDGVQLVWTGSSSTLKGLELARPLLENLGQKLPGLRLKLICDRFAQFAPLSVLTCPWVESDEPFAIAAADVGISWVPRDDWSRGKCGLKVLQYMAAGLPVIANPVGVQAEMVRPGETGFLAETPEQWVEAVARLAADPDLRRRMGEAGRRLVEKEYAVAVGAERWLALLDRLGQRKEAA